MDYAIIISILLWLLIGYGIYWLARNTAKWVYYVLTSIPLIFGILMLTIMFNTLNFLVFTFFNMILIISYYSWITALWRASIEGETLWYTSIYVIPIIMIPYWFINTTNN